MKSTVRFSILLASLAALTLGCAFFGQLVDSLTGTPTSQTSAVNNPTAEAQITPAPDLLDSEANLKELFAPVWESRDYLQQYFVEQPVKDEVLAQGALDGLSAFLEEQGFKLEDITVSEDATSADSLARQAETPADSGQAFAAFWEAWRTIQFGDAQLVGTYADLMHAALRAMVQALGDPHTAFMDPNQVQQSDIQLEGEYDGIGAFVDTTTEFVTIIAPMEGSPAEAAGLKPGDMVIAVDGEDMTGIPGDAVIGHILGPAGSRVVLTIRREAEPEPFDVEVVREHISVPSTQGRILDGDIAYVQLLTFGANSATELHDKLETLLAENPKGLILDLRNNGGGFLNTAVSITSEFLTDGVVLYEEYGDGTRDEYSASSGGIAADIYLVVLVNQG
ncbi:MAG TPA: S41 family peptidase, partial [Anaerolineales bacterium]|nr:S41 family peptidase [Anaerolineales bacterium]